MDIAISSYYAPHKSNVLERLLKSLPNIPDHKVFIYAQKFPSSLIARFKELPNVVLKEGPGPSKSLNYIEPRAKSIQMALDGGKSGYVMVADDDFEFKTSLETVEKYLKALESVSSSTGLIILSKSMHHSEGKALVHSSQPWHHWMSNGMVFKRSALRAVQAKFKGIESSYDDTWLSYLTQACGYHITTLFTKTGPMHHSSKKSKQFNGHNPEWINEPPGDCTAFKTCSHKGSKLNGKTVYQNGYLNKLSIKESFASRLITLMS